MAQGTHDGFATLGEIAAYLRVSARRVPGVLEARGITPTPYNRVRWSELWRMLWRIDPAQIPPEYLRAMYASLLTNAEVAARVGCDPRTIRDAGNVSPRQKGIPEHLDLGPSTRRHHPVRIEAWLNREPCPEFLVPRAPRANGLLGLTQRRNGEGCSYRKM